MNSYELDLQPIRELLLEVDDETLRDDIRYEVQKLILETVEITRVEIVDQLVENGNWGMENINRAVREFKDD